MDTEVNLKEFRTLIKKYLEFGYRNLSWNETDDICYDCDVIINNKECFTEDDILIAQLVLKSCISEQHNELTTALKGDLYTKDMSQTNEYFISALAKVGRWFKSDVEFETKYGTAKLIRSSDSGEWNLYKVTLKNELIPEEKRNLFSEIIDITVRQMWDETLEEAIEQAIMTSNHR